MIASSLSWKQVNTKKESSINLAFPLRTIPPGNQIVYEGKHLFREVFKLTSEKEIIDSDHSIVPSLVNQWTWTLSISRCYRHRKEMTRHRVSPMEDTPAPVISLKDLGLPLIRRLDPAANGQGTQRTGEHAGLRRQEAVSKKLRKLHSSDALLP